MTNQSCRASLHVGAAQNNPTLGELDTNWQLHAEVIRDARMAGIDLLVFPELSLTGYRLRQDIPQVACRSSDDRLLRLAKLVGPMQTVVGFVEDCGPGEYANAVAVMQEG